MKITGCTSLNLLLYTNIRTRLPLVYKLATFAIPAKIAAEEENDDEERLHKILCNFYTVVIFQCFFFFFSIRPPKNKKKKKIASLKTLV